MFPPGLPVDVICTVRKSPFAIATEPLVSHAVVDGVPVTVQEREFPAVVSPFFLTVTVHEPPAFGAVLISAQIEVMVPAALTS